MGTGVLVPMPFSEAFHSFSFLRRYQRHASRATNFLALLKVHEPCFVLIVVIFWNAYHSFLATVFFTTITTSLLVYVNHYDDVFASIRASSIYFNDCYDYEESLYHRTRITMGTQSYCAFNSEKGVRYHGDHFRGTPTARSCIPHKGA